MGLDHNTTRVMYQGRAAIYRSGYDDYTGSFWKAGPFTVEIPILRDDPSGQGTYCVGYHTQTVATMEDVDTFIATVEGRS